MTACVKCGFNAAAQVTASWTFEIARTVESMNGRVHNVGRSRWEYAKQRDGWTRDMLTIRRVHGIPIPDCKRRVTLTRMYSGRRRELDADNLIGGLKSAVDAMVHAGLLIGDRPGDAEIHYAQERMKVGSMVSGLRVLLEDIK